MSRSEEARAKGGRIAKTAFVADTAVLDHPVDVADGATIYAGANLGAFSYVNVGSVLYAKAKVGRYCSIGRHVEIGLATHPVDFLSTHPFQVANTLFSAYPGYASIQRKPWTFHRETHIGNDVWIGAKASIAGGVRVGHGCIVAAGAVVSNDVPPYMIVGGVPAKVIRPRFADDVIASLLELCWWDLPLHTLSTLPFDDIHKCIDALRVARAASTSSNTTTS